MRQRLAIIITLVIVIVVLIALNAASYVRVEHVADLESSPDRSTFNSGATGTEALYDFLRESGQKVVRWRESPSSLLTSSDPPGTFVIVGRTQIPYSRTDIKDILSWVESGGRLVIIDRNPDRRLLLNSKDRVVTTEMLSYPWTDVDPNNFEQMTSGVKALRPSQPTLMARNVESVMPSRFMGVIKVSPSNAQPHQTAPTPTPETEETDDESDEEEGEETTEPAAGAANETPTDDVARAPVVHLKQERGAVLVDYPQGKGRVVLLSDPFIVANNGIGRADNLLLAVNIVGKGTIAFDEYHQGRANTHNAIIQYFSGTPVLAICAQLGLIGLAIVWSRGRRFARPLPLPHVDRRSKLEFVASMAELQQRARAHDLALENIYSRVRRVLVRYAGVSNSSPRAEIAKRVAKRSGVSQNDLETLMRNCEDTINGAPTNAKESLQMVKQLREIESRLGLHTRSRDVRQAERP